MVQRRIFDEIALQINKLPFSTKNRDFLLDAKAEQLWAVSLLLLVLQHE